MRALDVKLLRWDNSFLHRMLWRYKITLSSKSLAGFFPSSRISTIIRPSFANSRKFVYRVNKTMFFDNLPLEITCSKCGKQINETVNWLKAERSEMPLLRHGDRHDQVSTGN